MNTITIQKKVVAYSTQIVCSADMFMIDATLASICSPIYKALSSKFSWNNALLDEASSMIAVCEMIKHISGATQMSKTDPLTIIDIAAGDGISGLMILRALLELKYKDVALRLVDPVYKDPSYKGERKKITALGNTIKKVYSQERDPVYMLSKLGNYSVTKTKYRKDTSGNKVLVCMFPEFKNRKTIMAEINTCLESDTSVKMVYSMGVFNEASTPNTSLETLDIRSRASALTVLNRLLKS